MAEKKSLVKSFYTDAKHNSIMHAVKHAFSHIKFVMSTRTAYFNENLILRFTKNKPLKNVIIMESHNDFDCNGGALYNYFLSCGINNNYKIIWLLKNKTSEKLPLNVLGFDQYSPSPRKAYYICCAKYFFADNQCQRKMREDQVYVYMTHGPVPLKNTNGIIKLPYNINYCLSPSHFFDRYQRKAFTISNPDTVMLHLGFPCLDEIFNDEQGDLIKITQNKYKKNVLWMPTFRKGARWDRCDVDYDVNSGIGIPIIKNIQEYERLNDLLASIGMLLIIKIHPKQDLSSLKITSKSNIIVLTIEDMKEKDLSNYRLYKDMDAMISDYSSASFDFLNLNRPICYDFSDYEHYKPGLLMENPDDFMPGPQIYDYEGLIGFLNDVSAGIDEYKSAREALINRLFEHHDGNSCRRIVEFLGI